MTRPSKPERVDWGNAGVEPSGAKKTTGHSTSDVDKPTANQFNWFWDVVTRIQDWLFGPARYNVIIDSDTDEGDYTTLATYIDDSPAVGDRVLVKTDQASSVNITLPTGITLAFIKGVKLDFDTAIATSCLEIGDNTCIEGELFIEVSNAGGTQAKVILFNGSNSKADLIRIDQTQAGSTITDVVAVAATEDNNFATVIKTNSGAGTTTNLLTDSSTEITNLIVVTDGTNVTRSIGASIFEAIGINVSSAGASSRLSIIGGLLSGIAVSASASSAFGIEVIAGTDADYALRAQGSDGAKAAWLNGPVQLIFGSDATGDIWFRNAGGDMERLPVGSNGDRLELVAGLPAWVEP